MLQPTLVLGLAEVAAATRVGMFEIIRQRRISSSLIGRDRFSATRELLEGGRCSDGGRAAHGGVERDLTLRRIVCGAIGARGG